MATDFQTIFHKYNISVSSSGRHHRQGFSNVVCPFCTGSDGFHLGFNSEGSYAVCFRCKSKNVYKALAAVLKVSSSKASQIIKQHTTGFVPHSFEGFKPEVDKVNIEDMHLRPLIKSHREYLEQRGFNIDRLVHFFNIQSTGNKTEPFFHRNKIFIPYILNGELITYSLRDPEVDTKQSENRAKYITCKKKDGLLPPNYFIYNFDNIRNRKKKRTLFFEGPFDCARFPTASGALSGISFPPSQLKFIIDNFDYPVFILDQDEAGQTASQVAFDHIEVLTGKSPEVYTINDSLMNPDGSPKDLADMTYQEADNLIKQLEIQI